MRALIQADSTHAMARGDGPKHGMVGRTIVIRTKRDVGDTSGRELVKRRVTDEQVVIKDVDTRQKMAYLFVWKVGLTQVGTAGEGPKMDLDPAKFVDAAAELNRSGSGSWRCSRRSMIREGEGEGVGRLRGSHGVSQRQGRRSSAPSTCSCSGSVASPLVPLVSLWWRLLQSPPQQPRTILEVTCRLKHFGFARHYIDAQTASEEGIAGPRRSSCGRAQDGAAACRCVVRPSVVGRNVVVVNGS